MHRFRNEHVQGLVHILGGHEMVHGAGQFCSSNALNRVMFDRKWWSLGNLDVAEYAPSWPTRLRMAQTFTDG